ncbi:MAG: glycosyltransferase [Breznakibacter sp.]
MITICIPVYNFNVNALVDELIRQAHTLNVPVEIIAIDDCSFPSFRNLNTLLPGKTRFVQLERNIGRAKIRNLFLQYATYDHLLFLDCDALIIRHDFLIKYIDTIPDTTEYVVCGGRIYDPARPPLKKMLRWKYGIERESRPVEVRQQDANRSFMTNNFIIHKLLLESVKFEERLTDYGHEDTLFGYALKKRKIAITHIDNPILNGDVEDNDVYLAKTERSIWNLLKIVAFTRNDTAFVKDVSLLRAANKLKKFGIKPLVRFLFRISKNTIRKKLSAGQVNLTVFDFYKLGLLFEHENNPS